MAVIYTKTLSTTCPGHILKTINTDVGIGPVCLQIVEDGTTDVKFVFNSALSAGEEAVLDGILATAVCPILETPPDDYIIEFVGSPLSEGNALWTADRITTELDALVLDDLADVVTTGSPLLTNGQVLTYDQGTWTGKTPEEVFGETTTTLTVAGNVLTYTDEDGVQTNIDLSLYLDDTNLARLVSGTLDGVTGIATFTRDDATTFTVDFSPLFDDTNLSRIDAGSFNTVDGNLTLTRDDLTTAATINLDGRYLTSYTETDPVFSASTAAGITGTDVTNWNTAFGWGDHSTAGYLTSYTETDPIFTASAAFSIGSPQIVNWDTAFGWGDHSAQGYLTNYIETDPVFSASVASSITGTDVLNWNNAFSWGDHSLQGYLTTETLTSLSLTANTLSYVDENGVTTNLDLSLYLDDTNLSRLVSGTLDGVTGIATFTRDDASTFTVDFSPLFDDTNLSRVTSGSFDSVTGIMTLTRDDATVAATIDLNGRYLTEYTETDPIFTASAAFGIGSPQIANWDTAFSWGNHALAGYLTTETDPVFSASTAAGITATDVLNWNNAFGWGDHALVGYLTTETDPIFTASAAFGIGSPQIANWDAAFSWGDHALAGYLTSFTETDPVFTASTVSNIADGTGFLRNDGLGNWTYDTNNYVVTETVTSLSLATNILTYTDELGAQTNIDLSLYLDDTNLARLVSGTIDGVTGIATFTRDDASTFTVDFSPLFDDTNLSRVTSGSFNNVDGNLTLTRDDLTTAAVINLDGRYLTTETDPVFTASAAFGIGSPQIANWDTAFGWGDHSTVGYLTSYTETDPVFSASVAASIGSPQVTNWDTAFGWGDHSTAGYLTTVALNDLTDVDTTGAAPGSIIKYNGTNWVVAADATGEGGTITLDSLSVVQQAPAGGGTLTYNNANGVFTYTPPDLAGIVTETDPIFTASAAFGIGSPQIANWDTAFSWGDHSTVGYLTSYTETDPIFTASAAFGIGSPQIANWNTAFSWGDHALAGYLTSFTETDPVFTASAAFGIGSPQIVNWDTAFGWGDHSTAGYLTTETVTSLSLATNILTYTDELGAQTNIDLSLYLDDTNLARLVSGTIDGVTGIATFTRDDASTFTVDFSPLFDDTNLARVTGGSFDTGTGTLTLTRDDLTTAATISLDGRYLTSFTETDPVFSASTAAGITATDVTNWNTAFGWGDHSVAGYLTSYTETDPIFTASAAFGIGSPQIANWDTAFSWGDHSLAGYLTAETSHADVVVDGDFISEGLMRRDAVSGTYSIVTDNSANWNTAFGWGDHSTAGYLTTETVTSLSLATNILTYTDELGAQTNIDLSVYLDDTNLARLVSGSIDGVTGIATFTRDDASTFTVDFSPLFDDTNLSRIDSGSFDTGTGVLTLTRDDLTTAATVNLDGRYLTSFTETDPVFSASTAAGITATDVTNWNTAFGWGDHSTAGYLTTETSHADVVVDGDFISEGLMRRDAVSGTYSIVTDNSTNWNTAFSWGDHSLAGYLTSFTETDPVFSASTAAGITVTDVTNWNTAFGWGDHSTAGYLTSVALNDVTDVTITTPVSGEVLYYNGTGWVNQAVAGAVDEAVKVSANDTTAGFLEGKIVAGTNITLTTLNEGANEQLQINAAGGGASTLNELTDVTLTTPAINEVLTYNGTSWVNLTLPAGSTDEQIKISANDTTAGYLDGKLVSSDSSIILTQINDGGNETLDVQLAPHVHDITDIFAPGSPSPNIGDIITWDGTTWEISPNQATVQDIHADIGELAGTATIPILTTAPLPTDGAPLWTATVTPQSVSNEFQITSSMAYGVSKAAALFVVTVFRDGVCVGSMVDKASATTSFQTISFTIHDSPNTLAPVTYECRVGTSAASSWSVNTNDVGENMGGTIGRNSYMILEKAGTV